MSCIGFLLIVSLIFNLALSLLVLLKGPRLRIKIFYLGITISIFLWNVFILLIELAQSGDISFLGRIIFLPPALLVYFFLWFTFVFPDQEQKLNPVWMVVSAIPTLLIVLKVPTDFIMISTYKMGNGTHIFYKNFGHYFFAAYFLSYGFFSFINMLKNYQKADASFKEPYKYLLYGFGLPLLFASITNLILPMLGYSQFVLVGPIFSIILVLFTAYAVVKHELMDIRILITSGTALVITGLFIVISFVLLNLMPVYTQYLRIVLNSLLGILWALAAYPFQLSIQTPLKEKWRHGYNPDEFLYSISIELSPVFEKEEIFEILRNNIEKYLHVKRIDYFVGRDRFAQPVSTSVKQEPFPSMKGKVVTKYQRYISPLSEQSLPSEDPMILMFNANREIRTNRSLERVVKRYEREMKLSKYDLFVPLFSTKSLEGVMFLGKKQFSGAFSHKDMMILRTILNQVQLVFDRHDSQINAGEKRMGSVEMNKIMTLMKEEISSPIKAIELAAQTLSASESSMDFQRRHWLTGLIIKEIEKIRVTLQSINPDDPLFLDEDSVTERIFHDKTFDTVFSQNNESE
ncbi:hypothetical protein ACFL96_00350 [Thermoproteota archaeon]